MLRLISTRELQLADQILLRLGAQRTLLQMKNRRLIRDQDIPVPNAEILGIESYAASQSRGRLNVLDLGCGEGANSLYLAYRGHRVTAVDADESNVDELRRTARSFDFSLNVIREDVRTFSFDEQYDLILCYGLAHFLAKPERERLFQQIKASTTSGGYNLYAIAPFEEFGIDRALLKQGQKRDFNGGEIVERYESAERLLRQSYIKIENHEPDGLHTHRMEKYIFQPSSSAGNMVLKLTPAKRGGVSSQLSETVSSSLRCLTSIDDIFTLHSLPQWTIRYPLNGFFGCVECRIDFHGKVAINSIDGSVIGLHVPIDCQYLLPK